MTSSIQMMTVLPRTCEPASEFTEGQVRDSRDLKAKTEGGVKERSFGIPFMFLQLVSFP